VLALTAAAPSCKKELKEQVQNRTPDVNFVPTPQVAVEKMLELADIKPGEVLYDLGCGDGRIVVTAAKKYGIKAKGFDIDQQRVKESKENVKKNKVEHLVTIQHADIFTLDLSEADVITLYLLPELNVKLIPQLMKLKKGARIISYEFDMKGAKPTQVYTNKFGGEIEHTIYKWVAPWASDVADTKIADAKDKPKDDANADATPAKDTKVDDIAKTIIKKNVTRQPDIHWVPTHQVAVNKMLEMADIKKGDILYDLGCGDGRIVVTAAKKYGIKAWGFDIDPQRIKDSLENVRRNKVEHLVTIVHADVFTLDLSKANVVTLYLLPELNVKLMPQLRKMKKGSRIVSYDFDMRGAKPFQVVRDKLGGDYEHTIYKWIVPWKSEWSRRKR
jgi:ribosomal protein L11 methylase PrmA